MRMRSRQLWINAGRSSRRGGLSRASGGVGSGRSEGGDGTKINVTPLIDVVMCLIVFYLIVAKLASDRQLPVDLPGARSGANQEAAAPIIISIGPAAGGALNVEVGGEAVKLTDKNQAEQDSVLREAIRVAMRIRPDAAVHLRADRSLAYGRVKPIVEACRAEGVSTLLLVASREGERGTTP